MFRWLHRFAAACACACPMVVMCSTPLEAATLPPGFSEEAFGGTWNEAVGITFAADGTFFGWERNGRVWMYHDDAWHNVIDIRDEVGGWRDFGLLGVALHPNFLNNGQVFLLYVVDRHHLLYDGTPNYDPNANHYFAATIGRITRYTLDPKDDFHSADYESRLVLVGEDKTTGFPILHESHGTGSLVFGADGTLLASCGDGASYNATDTGGAVGGSYAVQALADGIIKPKENVGAYRAQLVDCLNGKVIRIDPDTGDGVPSNPFYSAAAPRAPKSRVWALGLRNPCRMSLRPGTGSHHPEDGNPGVLYIGDVGWGTWEDLHVADGPRLNFGWPNFEGLTVHSGYNNANIQNLDAPNPLYNGGSCNQQYFYFRNLIQQETLNPNPSFPNPCNAGQQIPATIPTFVHRRPRIDWGRPNGPARTGIFNGNNAAVINVGAGGSPVSGPQFGGNCSIGGVWYTGSSYPVQFQNKYFHCDYGTKWIKAFTFNSNNQPTAVQDFATNAGNIVGMAVDPISGDLYYISWTQVFRVSYTPATNQPPAAVASSNLSYGSAPLQVQFTGDASSDPENQALQYNWNFGDGTPNSNLPNPLHTFNAPPTVPTQFNVTLTVTDPGNLTSQDTLIVSANNTPPQVAIVSPAQGSTFPMSGNSVYNLVADIADAEHDAAQLQCQWQTTLHHNEHTHPEPPDSSCVTSATISPVGCDGNLYFYRFRLTVTDAAGLVGADEVDVYPNCKGNQAPTANGDVANVPQYGSVDIPVLANDTDPDGQLDPGTVAVIEAPDYGALTLDPLSGVLTYQHDGTSASGDTFAYTVNDDNGGTSNLGNVIITIEPVVLGDVTGDGVVNVQDLLTVIAAWGPCPAPPRKCPEDINPPAHQGGGDGVVNVGDLLFVIQHWG